MMKAKERVMRLLNHQAPDVILMGDVDTISTLYLMDPETVRSECERTIADGIQILAPGCAVAPGTPLENLLAMVDVARSHAFS